MIIIIIIIIRYKSDSILYIWIGPAAVRLSSAAKIFEVYVDPRGLPIGVHTEFVYGYEESRLSRGSVGGIHIPMNE